MHPLVGLRIPSTPGRHAMPMRMVLAMTPMRLDHDTRATPEGLAAPWTKESVPAVHSARPARTEPRFGMRIKGWSQDIRHGEDTMPIDDPVMEPLPNLSPPLVDLDPGTSQTQRRLPAPGNTMFALTTMETAVCAIASLVRMPAPEHCVDKGIVGRAYGSADGTGSTPPHARERSV